MKLRLMHIADAEGCSEQEKALVDDILENADGDMRRAVTTLQSVHALATGGCVVDRDAIAEIAGLPPPSVVSTLYSSIQSKNLSVVQAAVEDVVAAGYSAQVLLSALLPRITVDANLTERSKAEIAIRIAEAEKNMIEGADEYLQLMTVFSLAVTVIE
jgi:replication factor C subunit 2/4